MKKYLWFVWQVIECLFVCVLSGVLLGLLFKFVKSGWDLVEYLP